MVYAWRTAGERGHTYSIDKLVLDWHLEYRQGQALFDTIASALWVETSHWECRKMGSFRDQFTFELSGGRSFWLGVGLNSPTGLDARRARLELNPNKVGQTRALRWLYNLLWDSSTDKYHGGPQVKRWDLAVDVAAPREDFELQKDGRLYEEYRKSPSNRTQYLGQRNAPGRVKLYNKALDAGLDIPLTRVELTLAGDDCSPSRAAELWPLVYQQPPVEQLGLTTAALNETDRFILKTLWQQPERLGELSRRKRAKLEPLLVQTGPVKLDMAAYRETLGELQRWQQRQASTPAPGWDAGSFKEVIA